MWCGFQPDVKGGVSEGSGCPATADSAHLTSGFGVPVVGDDSWVPSLGLWLVDPWASLRPLDLRTAGCCSAWAAQERVPASVAAVC